MLRHAQIRGSSMFAAGFGLGRELDLSVGAGTRVQAKGSLLDVS